MISRRLGIERVDARLAPRLGLLGPARPIERRQMVSEDDRFDPAQRYGRNRWNADHNMGLVAGVVEHDLSHAFIVPAQLQSQL
jgi:hypothetical protein